MKVGLKPGLVMVIILVGWEMASDLFATPDWLLPSPSTIIHTGVTGFGSYQHHLLSTIQLSLIGFVIGVGFGIMIAALLHLVPVMKDAFYPLMILSQNIPIIVLAPLLVIWFGFGVLPKLIVITMVCFFPVAVALLDGFGQTNPDLRHYLQMAGANRRQIFWKLEIPSSLPSLFSGLKISATYSVMGAVIAEWLGAKEGIGVYMTLASASFHTDRVFVAIFYVMVLSFGFFLLIIWMEKSVLHWQARRK